jgi:hypothetical protein
MTLAVAAIRLEERLPAGELPAFRVLVTSDFEAEEDRQRATEIAADLGVDRYFLDYRPADLADVEVVVRVISDTDRILAALQEMQ